MYFSRVYAVLVGAACIASAIPAPAPTAAEPNTPARVDKRAIIVPIVQQIQETNIIVVQQNLDVIEELAQVAEQQFAARLQAEFALITQLETIKNNIRVNHFRNMFSSINVVVVTVTNVLDVRDASVPNNRYFVNQLLADNGNPESQMVVMVTASNTITIGAAQETESVEIEQVIEKIKVGDVGLPTLRNYDASFPFGQLNESILLPYGTEAPTNALVFNDPANIIFAGQTGLFVENQQTFAQDCSLFSTLGNSFLSPVISLFASFQQLAAAQAINLILGSAIPPTFLFETASVSLSTTSTTSTETEEATATETEEATTTAEEGAAETTMEGEEEENKPEEDKKD